MEQQKLHYLHPRDPHTRQAWHEEVKNETRAEEVNRFLPLGQHLPGTKMALAALQYQDSAAPRVEVEGEAVTLVQLSKA